MGGPKKSTAKKLKYKVLGKGGVSVYFPSPGGGLGLEGISTVKVRYERPKDDPAMDAEIKLIIREAREYADRLAREREQQQHQQQSGPDPHKLK
ncbi:MAG TPA: hypothetical protein VND93_32595 [Myxococcales bacterium]|jgi:hypothetical protein|nr:hypothetical protein [Myxococcales bacterium]